MALLVYNRPTWPTISCFVVFIILMFFTKVKRVHSRSDWRDRCLPTTVDRHTSIGWGGLLHVWSTWRHPANGGFCVWCERLMDSLVNLKYSHKIKRCFEPLRKFKIILCIFVMYTVYMHVSSSCSIKNVYTFWIQFVQQLHFKLSISWFLSASLVLLVYAEI